VPGEVRLVVVWYLATALAVWASGFTAMINSDLWFHLAAGREIWQARAIPRVDTWSFTAAGLPWHNHEWLSGLFFHLWSRLFGVASLVYWQGAVLVAAFLLVFRVLERLSGSRLAAYLLLLLVLAVAAPFFDIRPHLWSLLGFAIVVHQTLVRPAPSRALPLLFLVWINLHGGAVFGLMALAVGLGAKAFAPGPISAKAVTDRAAALRLGGLWLACLLATLVNPFGWEGWLYPLRLAFAASSASRTTLVEWLPPSVPGGIRSPLYPAAIALCVVAAVALVAAGAWKTRRRETLATLGLAALTLAMAQQSRRFIPLFAVSQALVAALAAGELAAARARRAAAGVHRVLSRRARAKLELAALALALAAGAVRLAPQPLGPRAFATVTRLDTLPVAALDFMTENRLAGNVFTQLLWGGYVRYRTPVLPVFMDPRSETVYPETVQRPYFRVYFGQPGWRQVVDGSRADYFLWPVNSDARRAMAAELVASGGWDEVYRDDVAVLLARRGAPLPPPPAVPGGAAS
jgi:hypothetical protein